MKKALTLLAGALLVPFLSSQAWADDEASAKSVNAVGVIKYEIPAEGGMACIALPLNPMSNTNWVWGETTLADQLDVESQVFFWNETSWRGYTKNRLSGDWPPAAKNRVIQPGEAFFVKSAATNTTAKIISLLGELPTEDTLSYGVTGNNNLDTKSVSMYPVQSVFGTSELAGALPVESQVFFWNETSWKGYTKNKLSGAWPPAASNRVVSIGEGIFVRSAGNADTVTMDRPFDWE